MLWLTGNLSDHAKNYVALTYTAYSTTNLFAQAFVSPDIWGGGN